jgi:hypothetical protein
LEGVVGEGGTVRGEGSELVTLLLRPLLTALHHIDRKEGRVLQTIVTLTTRAALVIVRMMAQMMVIAVTVTAGQEGERRNPPKDGTPLAPKLRKTSFVCT